MAFHRLDRAQKPAQDHDSLVVRRSRHPRLALDIDHARLPERDGRRHSRRTSEAVTADIQHGQPVDLSDTRSANIYDECAFRDQPADFLFDKIEPQHPFGERPLDMRRRHALRSFAAREVPRLAREVVDRLKHRKHALSVLARRTLTWVWNDYQGSERSCA